MEHREYRRLHAEWYEYMSTASPDLDREIDYWARSIEAAGEPVLELGSGTGKVLVPLLERGFDVTGIDTSEDMMARCRAICQRKGLKPQLYEQSMLHFELPRRFKLIILPSGSLSLFTADEDVRSMFRRVVAHLEPGGVFMYGFENILQKAPQDNNNWTGGWIRGPGDIVIAWRNHWRHNTADHTWETLFIVEKFVGGRLVESEANERTGRRFSVDQAVAYAREAGLEEVRVTHGLTEEPPRPDSGDLMVRCRKPG